MSKEKILDFYLNNSYLIDILIVASVWIVNTYFVVFTLKPSPKLDLIAQLSSLISAAISFAGFILAALTIIAALKANISSKSLEETKNPLELFFSSVNYTQITTVFKESIIELVMTTIWLYIIWLLSSEVTIDFLFKTLVCGCILIFLSVFRTLLVLFTIMGLEK